MREEEAGITRCTGEWSVKCDGEVKIEMTHGEGMRVAGGVKSQWSMLLPLRGKVGVAVSL
jgi:hypothetical protein